ncbi:HIT family protein [Woodsholea maritima]|uniref:HIT family protein n=1 Tax=Woodsholea maritima TaxID=240237 RepID=UPI00036A0B2F|nr:HIT family protein [Woodsholea maritima]
MSMHLTYDPHNIFAKIIAGEIPCVKVFEDDHVLSFMDIYPQSKGHTLVVPKAGAINMIEMEPEDLQNAIIRAQHITRAVKAALEPEGIIFTQFNGEVAGQTIFHVHFHIIPRWADQPLGRHGGGQADLDDLKALAEQIKAKL